MSAEELLDVAERMLRRRWIITVEADNKAGELWYAQDPGDQLHGPYHRLSSLLENLSQVVDYL